MPETPRPPDGPANPAPDTPTVFDRLRSRAAFRQRLTDLALLFSRSVSSSDLAAALAGLSRDTNDLFGAARTSVWLHNRRTRELALAASSDAAYPARPPRVSTSDAAAPAARGLRLEHAQLLADAAGAVLVAPLRGIRRALGTLVIERPGAVAIDDAQLVELADELGRQLSVSVESVQLLDEIIRQRRLLEDTFNSLIDLVVVTDTRQRIVQMNDAFAGRVGLAREELLERELDAFVGRELARWAAAAETAEQRAEQAGTARTRRMEDERLGGTFFVTVTPLITEHGAPVGRVLIARDVTMQARLEAERESLRERLGQSEKLASLGQFVAGIAHEMNNPLQGVLGHLELMIDAPDLDSRRKKDLRAIYQEANRAAKIVSNLLAFTGSHHVSKRRLRIDRVLSRVLSSRAASLRRKQIQVVRDYAPDLPSIVGDSMLLHQAFLNVVINAEHALAAAANSRVLAIRTACADRATVVTTIRDSGPGIAAEALPRIFDPFYTTKEVGQGTGLGLAITYGIIQEHGGAIHAANAEGGGAEFTIELPAAPN